jgi:hypothetical protein
MIFFSMIINGFIKNGLLLILFLKSFLELFHVFYIPNVNIWITSNISWFFELLLDLFNIIISWITSSITFKL